MGRFGHHLRGHGHPFGHHFHRAVGHPFADPHWFGWPQPSAPFDDTSSGTSSSSESDSDSGHKKSKKIFKKWKKFGGGKKWKKWAKKFGPLVSFSPVHCSLCWHRVRPLATTEVLDCGHIYHRQCLKELFAISQTQQLTQVFCSHCRQEIDAELGQQLQNRFNDETDQPNDQPKSPYAGLSKDMEVLNVV